MPLDAHVLKSGVRRIIITHSKNTDKIHALEVLGVELSFYQGELYPVFRLLQTLGSMGISSIMVEGGAMVFNEFIKDNACDEIFLFRAPHDVAQGISLTESILRGIVTQDYKPQMIGEDCLYHVYRNH